jgi:PAS domain S-box-containing protein
VDSPDPHSPEDHSFERRIAQAQERLEALDRRTDLPSPDREALLAEAREEISHLLEELHAQNQALEEVARALEAERERYAALFDFAPDAYLVTDEHGIIRRANRAAVRMLGVSRENLLSKPLALFVVPECKRDFYAQLTRLQAGEAVGEWEVRVAPRHGSPVPVLAHAAGVQAIDGQTTGLRWLLHDISNRKALEEALQRRNRNLELLNRAGRAFSTTLDLQELLGHLAWAVVELVDAEAACVWLWEEGEEPQRLACRAASHAEVWQGLAHARPQPGEGVVGWVAQHGESARVDRPQTDPRFAPGKDVPADLPVRSLLVVPLQVRDGMTGVLQAINQRTDTFGRQHQVLLETLAATASGAIESAQLGESRQRYVAQLEARNRELDAFAHTVAHDLKNPLGLVIGYAKLLLLEGEDELSEPELQQALETIVRNAERMVNIIDELLLLADVRRMEQVQLEPLYVGNVVTEALDRVSHLIEESGAQVEQPLVWPMVMGYAPWLVEVWVNYLSNALKYGGSPPRIELGASEEEEEEGWVRLWVRDEGPGLTPEQQVRLFTPFVQLAQARATGHGLGLSIVRRIVDRLGGQVGVESEVGRGSTFWFTLQKAGEGVE